MLRMFDRRGKQQARPDNQRTASSSLSGLDFFTKGSSNAAWIHRPSVCTDQQGAHGLSTTAHLSEQVIRKLRIASQTDDSSQPQPRRNHHGQAHPGRHAPPFDADLIGLNRDQIQRLTFDQGLMHLLAMPSRAISPTRDSSFVEIKCLDNRLDWAAIGQQGDHVITSSVGLRSPSNRVPRLTLNV